MFAHVSPGASAIGGHMMAAERGEAVPIETGYLTEEEEGGGNI